VREFSKLSEDAEQRVKEYVCEAEHTIPYCDAKEHVSCSAWICTCLRVTRLRCVLTDLGLVHRYKIAVTALKRSTSRDRHKYEVKAEKYECENKMVFTAFEYGESNKE